MEPEIQQKLEAFFSSHKLQKYKKGETLIRPDDQITQVYFLKKGLVKQFLVSENGDEITINIFKPYSFFPIMLKLANTENKYYFEAIEPLEIYKAPADEVVNFLKQTPDVLFNLASRLSGGISNLSQRIEDLMFENAYHRVISILIFLSTRYGKETKDGLVIELNFTHKDIASWTNLTRETTSRQLEKLEHEDVINFKNHLITIKNLDRLKTQSVLR